MAQKFSHLISQLCQILFHLHIHQQFAISLERHFKRFAILWISVLKSMLTSIFNMVAYNKWTRSLSSNADPASWPILARKLYCRKDDRAMRPTYRLFYRNFVHAYVHYFADDLATFFVRKVADIRAATASSPPANIQLRDTTPFGTLEPVTVSEVVSKLLSSMPSKSCQLDPIPTWLLKQFQDIFAPVMASL